MKKVCPACDFPGRPKNYVRLKARDCLKCDRKIPQKRREPGLCSDCKRHVDYLEASDEVAA